MSFNYGGITAGDNATQHNGNNYNNYTHHDKPKPPKDGSYEVGLLDAAAKGERARVVNYLRFDLDLNTADADGRTALHLAAAKGYGSIASALIEAHCNLDALSPRYGTPLCEAANAGMASIVQLLLESGADPNAPGGWYGSAIHAACMSSSLPVLTLLLDAGADVNLRRRSINYHHNPDKVTSQKTTTLYWWSCTPLLHAARCGHTDLVATLLKAGVDANAAGQVSQHPHDIIEISPKSLSKLAPVHVAAGHDEPTILKLLVEKGADVNQKDSTAWNPMLYAVARNRPTCLEYLLENGASMLLSPLCIAARSDSIACMELLLDKGADPNEQDSDGYTPLFHATSVKCLEALARRTARLDERDRDGRTSLVHRVRWGDLDRVEALLDLGASVHSEDNEGNTALCFAREEIVKMLVRHGAQIEYRNEKGLTPLMQLGRGKADNAYHLELLLRNGADVNAVSPTGETALDLATDPEIVALLMKAGGKMSKSKSTSTTKSFFRRLLS